MNIRTSKLKNIILIPLTLGLFTGCSEDKKEMHSIKDAKVATASDITTSDNENAYDLKVASADDIKDRSYYYSYNKPIQKPHEVRTPHNAQMNVRSPYEDVRISLIVKGLSKKYILKCSPCHNDYANGLIGPLLLHKDADFIYKTIMQYKSGEKSNPLMVQMVKMMDDKEIKDLSKEIEGFNAEIKRLHAGEEQ
ncbi:MAG: hypothetical protein COA39_006665 [Sulfurimonas sp.]|nr:hypothetical protein [Sulfurimonas sp.]